MKDALTGTVEGTGAAINIQVGFVPSYVMVHNYDSAAPDTLEWFSGMTDGHALKTTGSTRSKSTSLGISAYAGTEGGDGRGFTIGADTDVNVSAETIYWLAIR